MEIECWERVNASRKRVVLISKYVNFCQVPAGRSAPPAFRRVVPNLLSAFRLAQPTAYDIDASLPTNFPQLLIFS